MADNFLLDSRVPLFNSVVGVTPRIGTGKFSLNKLETPLYCTVQSIFRYTEPFRRDSRVQQTDRRTDSLIAYAALHHVRGNEHRDL